MKVFTIRESYTRGKSHSKNSYLITHKKLVVTLILFNYQCHHYIFDLLRQTVSPRQEKKGKIRFGKH